MIKNIEEQRMTFNNIFSMIYFLKLYYCLFHGGDKHAEEEEEIESSRSRDDVYSVLAPVPT